MGENPRRRVDPEQLDFVAKRCDQIVGRSVSDNLSFSDQLGIVMDDYRDKMNQLEAARQRSQSGQAGPTPVR